MFSPAPVGELRGKQVEILCGPAAVSAEIPSIQVTEETLGKTDEIDETQARRPA
jgi:hypothetical protein